VAEAAAALAAAGRVATMPLLLRRHPRALLPSALDVLSAIPETLDPKQYAQLIKQVAAEQAPPPLGRAPDWVESAATAAELRSAGQYALLLATEPMCALAGWRPPTRRQLARWACERAQQLDAATGGAGCWRAAGCPLASCRLPMQKPAPHSLPASIGLHPLSGSQIASPRRCRCSCPAPPAGQLPFALSLLDAAHVALHHGEASVSRLLGTAQELLSLLKLGEQLQPQPRCLAAARGSTACVWLKACSESLL
jgi:hypothetical protein